MPSIIEQIDAATPANEPSILDLIDAATPKPEPSILDLIDEATPSPAGPSAVVGSGNSDVHVALSPPTEPEAKAQIQVETKPKTRSRKVVAEKKPKKEPGTSSSKALLEAIKSLLDSRSTQPPVEQKTVKAEEWEVEVIERDADGRTKRLRFVTK